ncbi:MAG: VanZ family protein [Bacteroidales bacterium]|nr:VanZ family protein [Bacteroidales bacterium]
MNRYNIISLILFLVYLGLVFWCCFGDFSSLPKIQREILGIPTDKVIHFVMFLPFVTLCFMAVHFIGKSFRAKLWLFLPVFIAGILFAIGIEIGQSLTSYRSGDAMDFFADAVGLCVSTIITIILVFIKKKAFS